MKLKKVRGYIFCRSFMGERIPQQVQNLMIREYCSKNKLAYLLSSTEYQIKNSYLILEEIINELKNIDGIVTYSLFQLPEKANIRKKIYNKILNKKKEIHFSLENQKIVSKKDIEKIESLWSIKKVLPSCLTSLD